MQSSDNGKTTIIFILCEFHISFVFAIVAFLQCALRNPGFISDNEVFYNILIEYYNLCDPEFNYIN